MRIIIFIIWLLLGVFYWKCHMVCCHDQPEESIIVNEPATNEGSPIMQPSFAIRFDCSSAIPTTGQKWQRVKDSILSKMTDDHLLEIKGYYFSEETDNNNDNLGIERARTALNLFEDEISENQVRLASKVKGDSCTVNKLSDLISFNFVRNTEKIKELNDKVIIYFASGSTNKLNDEEVERYLDDIVSTLKSSGASVIVTGHTDNVGSEASNLELGEKRAITIQDYFIKKGLLPQKVIVRSKGESKPIAPNDTEEGRTKNRRTELEIIKM